MNDEKLRILEKALALAPQCDYPVQSRVHPLRLFSGSLYLKRDDELGFGLTGSKVRKFRSLLPALQSKKVEVAAVIGGAYSNNVLGIVQLLKENGIEPLLFLRGEPSTSMQGTHLLIRMLVHPDAIKWISREDWKDVEAIAARHVENIKATGKQVIIIPEGSTLPDSVPGTVTLPLDIIRNEKALGRSFDRIFMDAGTGMTAAITLFTFAWLEKSVKTTIVLLADDPETFAERLKLYHAWFQNWLQQPVPFPENYETIIPDSKSFGAVNAEILDASIEIARTEGVLTDPIYSTKLLMAVGKNHHPDSFSLAVHSGGGLSISGYHHQLAKRMEIPSSHLFDNIRPL